MAKVFNMQAIEAKASNQASSQEARRRASNEAASRRFNSSVMEVDDLLNQLEGMNTPSGEVIFSSFREGIAQAEKMNKRHAFKDAWRKLNSLTREVRECLVHYS